MNEDNPEEREILSAKISRRAAEGWRGFCSRHGISVTSFIEVAGRELYDETSPPTVEARKSMVKAAREIDQARRSRRKK